jgi:predicted RNA-binding Zn-ribbon protein involved in translation (DUF1610 family)
MKKDLLAPPKMPPRTYAKVMGGVGAAAIALGTTLSVLSGGSLYSALARAFIVVGLAAAAIWAYSATLRIAHRSKPERLPLIHAFTTSLSLLTIMGSISLMIPAFRAMAPWWQVPFMFGLTFASGGWGRRVGDSMHCPSCDYEFNFDEHDAPIRCPECGTPWLGRLKRGRRVRSLRLAALGVALALFGGLLMNPIFYMPWIGPSLPTPLLYAALYASPRSMFQCWDELARRQLSPRWTSSMAERVMGYRKSSSWDQSPAKWLETQISAGQVPDDLATRFYAEGFQARLVVPSRATAGKPIDACLRITQASDGNSTLGVMFAGYAVDDGPLIDRAGGCVWAYQLRPGVLASYHDDFRSVLRAPHPGTARVRAVFWVIYQPSFNSLTWQPDGTPERPPKAAWYERRELEATVRVDP